MIPVKQSGLGMRFWNWEQFPDAFGTRLHADFQRILSGAERFPGSTRFLFADFFAVAFTVAPPAVGTFHGNCCAKDGYSVFFDAQAVKQELMSG